jgi:prophage regulatory protein
MDGAKRFLRLPAMMDMVGMARSTIYKQISAGIFPAPVQLGPCGVAWEEMAIAKWQGGLQTSVKKSAV